MATAKKTKKKSQTATAKTQRRVSPEPKIMARGQKRRHTKMPRERLDQIVARRHERKEAEKMQAKTRLVRMDRALTGIWNYIVDPINRISNHDADNILVFIKAGLGEDGRKFR